MTYRSPAFMVRHWASEALVDPATQIVARPNTAAISNDSKRSLIDYRVGQVASWTATSTNAGFYYDFLATPSVTFNRAVIPAGHTLGGWPLRWYSDDNTGFTTATLLDGYTPPSTSAVIDFDFGAPGAERYIAFQIATSGTETFTCSEAWIGVYEQLGADPFVDPTFSNSWVSQIVENPYPGGTSSLELAPPRRRFTLNCSNVTGGSSDYTILDSVARYGRAKPFWYWPPDTIDPGPFLVKLDVDAERAQEFQAPQVSSRYRYAFRMTEQTF